MNGPEGRLSDKIQEKENISNQELVWSPRSPLRAKHANITSGCILECSKLTRKTKSGIFLEQVASQIDRPARRIFKCLGTAAILELLHILPSVQTSTHQAC